MAKKAAVAYVPISSNIPTVPIAENNKEIPPYPDEGVRYEGFCKKYLGNNQYRLTPQKFYSRSLIFNWAGVRTLFSLNSNIEATSNFFVKNIEINGYSNTNCIFIVYQGVTDQVLGYVVCAANSSCHASIRFESPVQINFSQITMDPSVAMTGFVSVNLTGWSESKG
jgi:hypothetical protein